MRAERARLFVALELPDAARAVVLAWRDSALAGDEALRLTPKESLHVTLCFLGWRAESEVDAIAEASSSVTPGPIPLSLGSAIWLPRRRPRVLALQLHDSEGKAGALQAGLSEALHAGGFYEPESRPFLPHVTVARTRGGARAPKRSLPEMSALDFTACEVVLYRSDLRPQGARYEALARFALAERQVRADL